MSFPFPNWSRGQRCSVYMALSLLALLLGAQTTSLFQVKEEDAGSNNPGPGGGGGGARGQAVAIEIQELQDYTIGPAKSLLVGENAALAIPYRLLLLLARAGAHTWLQPGG